MDGTGIFNTVHSSQAYYLFNWYKTPPVSKTGDNLLPEGVTVVIVAHNAEKTISACLQGLLHQNYPSPLLDIIVVDDHSTDKTAAETLLTGGHRINLLRLQDYPEYIHAPAFKKSAITLAVHKSRFENIVVTDADCLHPENWLSTIGHSLIDRDAVFQTAPVILNPGRSLLEKMQEVEQLTFMLITGAGITSGLHDMANGANMAFRRQAFLQVKAYEGNEQYASGDDMFLIEKMRIAFPQRISFVKSLEATVYTNGKKDWPSLLKQRLRWAGKNKGLQNKSIGWIWLFIGVYQMAMILALLAALLHFISSWPFIMLLSVKWTVDYILIATAGVFFQRTSLLKYFVPLQFLYTYYILRLGIMMLIGKKGDWQEGGRAERRKGEKVF